MSIYRSIIKQIEKGSFFYLLFLGFGILLGFIISNYKYFVFKKEVSIESIFTILVTAFVGIWVARRIPKELNRELFHKNFFAKEVESVISELERLNHLLEKKELSEKQTKFVLQYISQRLGNLKSMLDFHDEHIDFKKIKQSFFKMKQILTDRKSSNIIELNDVELFNYLEQYTRLRLYLSNKILIIQKK